MKITLDPTQFVFTPSLNRISFANMGGAFKPERLLAITNISTGKLIYAVASQASGFSGTFSTGTFTNDRLTYASSNAGQSASDIIEVLYDSDTQAQTIAGTTSSYILDSATGNSMGGVADPSGGGYKLKTTSSTLAADGTPILSTVDPMTGGDGLNVHLQSSSYGGQVGNPIPLPNNNNALSVAFLNGSTLQAPRMDPVTNELIVQSAGVALQDVNLTDVDGAAISLGQKIMANSLPVTIASDQTAVPITAPTPINVNVTQSVSQDILGVAIAGNRNNQIEVSFNTAPSASLITNTFTGSGSVSVTNGHSIYSTGVTPSSSARATSVQETLYRPLHETYSAFTAAFLNPATACQSRIGLFDASNGFAIGYDGLNFSVFVRNGGSESSVVQSSFNTDILQGQAGSKFTRNGIPEALNKTLSNLFRIRFAWLGSANIYFEVFSPDGEWILFHNIRQPNSAYNPSIQDPNLPMTLELVKTSGATNSSIASACWGAGTTSTHAPITETLNDKSLAALTRSVITGESSAGGGSFVNVKVQASGALVTHINGTPDFNIAQYGGAATSLGQKVMTDSVPVVLASNHSSVATNTPDLYITGAANAAAGNNNLLAVAGPSELDVSGYKSAMVQVQIPAGASGTFVFQGSNSTTASTFQNVPAFRLDSSTPNAIVTSVSIVANTNFSYILPIKYRYMRLLNNGSVQPITALTRLSQEAFSPVIPNVINASGSALNATISNASLVVTQPTPANLNTTALVSGATLSSAVTTDINAVSVTTSGVSATITPVNAQSAAFALVVNVTSGSGTLDVILQEAQDGTASPTLWENIYTFERLTTARRTYIPSMRLSGTNLRLAYIVTGTVNYSVTLLRTTKQASSPMLRRLFDRVLNPNSTATPSQSLWVDGCNELDLVVSMGAGGTAPTIQLRGSEDGTNFYNLGTAITPAVGETTSVGVDDGSLPKWIRAEVTVAGVGSTLNYICLKGKSAG